MRALSRGRALLGKFHFSRTRRNPLVRRRGSALSSRVFRCVRAPARRRLPELIGVHFTRALAALDADALPAEGAELIGRFFRQALSRAQSTQSRGCACRDSVPGSRRSSSLNGLARARRTKRTWKPPRRLLFCIYRNARRLCAWRRVPSLALGVSHGASPCCGWSGRRGTSSPGRPAAPSRPRSRTHPVPVGADAHRRRKGIRRTDAGHKPFFLNRPEGL